MGHLKFWAAKTCREEKALITIYDNSYVSHYKRDFFLILAAWILDLIIISGYDRPTEVEELPDSLAHQMAENFHLVIVKDGLDSGNWEGDEDNAGYLGYQ